MADMTITGDAKFGSIVTEMQKVEKASDSMKRKVDNITRGQQGRGASQRGGMGVLEISRGVEDFAVAGMRGLMNNIPGIIMSLGGGMGLAGAISLAAVGLSVFGTQLMSMVAQADTSAETIAKLEAQTNSFAAGLKRLKKEKADAALALEIGGIKSAAASTTGDLVGKSEELKKQFEDEADIASQTRSIADAIAALNQELAKTQGKPVIEGLGKAIQRTEEDAGKLKDLIKGLGSETSVLEGALKLNKSGSSASPEIEDLNLKLAKSESIIAGFEAEIKSLEESATSMGTAVKDSLIKSFTDTIPRMIGLGDVVDRQGSTFSFEQRKSQAMQIAKGEMEAQSKIKKELENALAIKRAEAEASKMSSDEIEKAIQRNKEDLEVARKKEDSLRRQIEAEKQMAEIRKKIDEEKLKQSFAAIDAKLSGMGIGGGDMLSSSGRIGGSVAEYNSAIATINYQRETLKVLREIARNSARKQSSTYN